MGLSGGVWASCWSCRNKAPDITAWLLGGQQPIIWTCGDCPRVDRIGLNTTNNKNLDGDSGVIHPSRFFLSRTRIGCRVILKPRTSNCHTNRLGDEYSPRYRIDHAAIFRSGG